MHTPIEYKVRSSGVCQGFKVSIQEQWRQLAHLHAEGGGGQHATMYGMLELGYPVNECVYMRCIDICQRCTIIKTETCIYDSQYLHGFKVPSVLSVRTD